MRLAAWRGWCLSSPNYTTGIDAVSEWSSGLLSAEKPVLYAVGDGALGRIEIGPRLVTLIGGQPAVGKTALTTQLVFDALRLTPDLRCVIANCEMHFGALLDRQLARLSGVSLSDIRERELGDDGYQPRIDSGVAEIKSVADRLCFVRPPFDLGNVAQSVDAFVGGAEQVLLVVDYIQRFSVPDAKATKRDDINAAMSYLRSFADAGCAVMAIAAVSRQRGKSGSGYEGLGLASFRESSELEYSVDDAYILTGDIQTNQRLLKHVKARNSQAVDIALTFDGARQSFEAVADLAAEEWQA